VDFNEGYEEKPSRLNPDGKKRNESEAGFYNGHKGKLGQKKRKKAAVKIPQPEGLSKERRPKGKMAPGGKGRLHQN